MTGDVRHMHKSPENAGALFQVASQFNMLEMTGPEVTPEHGVTIYQYDGTQGPACAIAAGAATIYRNYFAPIGGSEGQTKVNWSRLSEQKFRVDKWSLCRVRPPRGAAEVYSRLDPGSCRQGSNVVVVRCKS